MACDACVLGCATSVVASWGRSSCRLGTASKWRSAIWATGSGFATAFNDSIGIEPEPIQP